MPVPPGVVMEEYMDMICCRLSVKAEGRKSGKGLGLGMGLGVGVGNGVRGRGWGWG